MTTGLFSRFGALLIVSACTYAATAPTDEFAQKIRPILASNCMPCHDPAGSNPNKFLAAHVSKDIELKRGLWRDVEEQIRNRSMPPIASKITEEQRLIVADWVDKELRLTACDTGPFAGASTLRRLNRREYHNTIRDLLGVDFTVASLLPADATGGAGFDTNGDTLYTGPMLTERYLEAAEQILDQAIITPPLEKSLKGSELLPSKGGDPAAPRALAVGEEVSFPLTAYVDGKYDINLTIPRTDTPPKLTLTVDGVDAGQIKVAQRGFFRRQVGVGVVGRRPLPTTSTATIQIPLERGNHQLTIKATDATAINEVDIAQVPEEPNAERKALHYKLLGTEPGEQPLVPRRTAQHILTEFLPRAYRRPIQPGETDRFMALYDRAAKRGDPWEECMKLALKGVLVSTDFLFKMEVRNPKPGIYPIGQYEMATRLSYFLWSTMPDEELMRLAAQGKLQDPKVLTAQVDRMLDDPRSTAFTSSFINQWLGTQDLGGRLVPLINTMASFYNAESAADLREEPIMLFNRIVGENRSLLELLTANYTYMTERLVKFYQMEDKIHIRGNNFQLVQWPDNRRAGVLGMAAPLAITSQLYQTNPILRGAWVLETILGTPVPPPPPGVKPLPIPEKGGVEPTIREKLAMHRTNPTCATCHKLMDPIGFGLENFDGLGRWRDKDSEGRPIDASGTLPSGEKFNGPVELRQALLAKKDDFMRQLTGKVMGYALGRSLKDGDSCNVQTLSNRVEKDNYSARTLIKEIVLSTPFRNSQGGVVKSESISEGKKVTERIIPCDVDGSCAPLKPDEKAKLKAEEQKIEQSKSEQQK
ncbi:MAG TPA: DUF1592 domain-containing protein [Bryobacteraceae bacterium]|nr:DUF1592 domain-containing protein [Bryobacteraceae bacterium]